MTQSTTNIMSVGEMIDTAFGDPEVNVVNHKLIQTILYLLARQLRILERRVAIEIGTALQPSSSSLSVTEVKIHAMSKKKKQRISKVKIGGGAEKNQTRLSLAHAKAGIGGRTGTGGGVGKGVGEEAGEVAGGAWRRGGGVEAEVGEARGVEREAGGVAEAGGAGQGTGKGKQRSDQTSDKTSSNKTFTEKFSSDKTSSYNASSGKTTTDNIITDKTSSDETTYGKFSPDKTSSDKTSTDKTTIKSPTEKATSDKTTTDKTSSSGKTTSDKTSSAPTTSSSKGKSSSDKTKTTTTDTTSLTGRGLPDYAFLREAVEEQREEVLRVIHQRADSREEHDKQPTPMASLDSVEATTYEKLLIVERIPADEAKVIAARERTGARDKAPRISIVTQEQFDKLATIVNQLQQKFGPVGSASFPENAQLMQELRKGASLTDAMAALQLSARLEASEKAMEQMMSLITDLASKTPGIDLTAGQDTEVLFGTHSTGSKGISTRKSTFKQPVVESETYISVPGETIEEKEKEKPDIITYDELDNALQELYDEIMKMVTGLTTKNAVTADNAYKKSSQLEGKLEASLNMGTRMLDLETLVSEYADQINILDTSLSSQMTNNQEELTQMQHDLETALESMAEVLASAGGDTTAVAELNLRFSNLQSDIEDTTMTQKELRNTQNALAFDLESLRKQIEVLRETKSDREEVADALRDKAGLGALNGLVSLKQFDAVRGDIEKRIGIAYDKFNSQETIWQKAIDELIKELNEKSDWIQVVSLKEEINKHLENLRSKVHAMLEIVGEPRAAAVSKKLHRDTTCLSCSTPAEMELEEHGIVPALPAMRPPAIGAEARRLKEDGDHGPCFPGHPIPHPRDPRSHVCQRWCGGSHTVISTLSRAPPNMIITPKERQVTTALGTDGRLYKVDETIKPCVQCARKVVPAPSLAPEPILEVENNVGSDMTPFEFKTSSVVTLQVLENETSPLPQDED